MSTTRLSGAAGKYKILVQLLPRKPRYAKAIADVSKPSEHDRLSHALFGVTSRVGGSLNIIGELLALEFSNKRNHPATILRVNSIASKMMGLYSQKHGKGYLRWVLGELIEQVITDEDLNLEIDPNKLEKGDRDDENVQTIVEKSARDLMDLCQKFFDRIVDSHTLHEMPRELRCIAHFVKQFGEEFDIDSSGESSVVALLGGFIMLRYFGPAITLPQQFGVISPDRVINAQARRHLTLICKVLQKLSNQERFDDSEPFMKVVNPFLERNSEGMRKYLFRVAVDELFEAQQIGFGNGGGMEFELDMSSQSPQPEEHEEMVVEKEDKDGSLWVKEMNEVPSEENESRDEKDGRTEGFAHNEKEELEEEPPEEKKLVDGGSEGVKVDAEVDLGKKEDEDEAAERVELRAPFENLDVPVSFEDLHVKEFDLKDLKFIHFMLDRYGSKIVMRLREEKAESSVVKEDSDFVKLIGELGPPPPMSGFRAHKSPKMSEPESSLEEKMQSLVDLNVSNLVTSGEQYDLTDLDRSGFFYPGQQTAHGSDVFYFILHRVYPELITNLDAVMVYILRVVFESLNSPMIIVADTSFVSITDDTLVLLHRFVINLTRVLSQKHFDNLKGIYVIHPSALMIDQIDDLLCVLPEEKKAELVHFVHDWRDLIRHGPFVDMDIPNLSKMGTVVSFPLRRLSDTGKSMDRLAFVTAESILLTDSSCHEAKEEIMFSDVESVTIGVLSLEIKLVNLETGRKVVKREGYALRGKGNILTLTFGSDEVMESFCACLHEMLCRSFVQVRPLVFGVVKTNRRGARQHRAFKFTSSCMLNLSKGIIHKVVPYASILNVEFDPANTQNGRIELLVNGQVKAWDISCEKMRTLKLSLDESVGRFNAHVNGLILRSLVRSTLSPVERFFEIVGGEELQHDLYRFVHFRGTNVTQDVSDKLLDNPRAAFQRLDFDKTGQLTLSELKYVAEQHPGADFTVSDLDVVLNSLARFGEDHITEEDFVSAWLTHCRMWGAGI